MILDATIKTIEFKLAGSVTTNQLPAVASFADYNTSTGAMTPGSSDTISNNTTAVTLVAAPASGSTRHVKTLVIYNNDTASATVTVQLNDNSTIRILEKATLSAGQTLYWSAEGGFASGAPFSVTGSITANAGTNLNTSALALDTTVAALEVAQASTTSGQSGALVQGAVTSSPPTYTTAKTNPLSLTTSGALRVDGSAVTQPVSIASNVGTTAGGIAVNTTSIVTSNGNVNNVNCGGCSTGLIQLTLGSATGTLVFEATADPFGSSNFVSLAGIPIGGGTPVTSTTANGAWYFPVTGFTRFQIRCTAGNGGTATLYMDAFNASTASCIVTPLPTGTNTIGALTANQSVNFAQVAGTTTDTNSGSKSAGTQRVVIATDQPQLTNPLLTTTNVNQLNGTTTDTNSGSKSAGTLRVVLATDQPQLTNPLLTTNDLTKVGSVSLTAAAALADAASLPTTLKVGSAGLLYNGSTVDLERGNVDVTWLSSTARTTTQTSSVVTNHNCRGIMVFISLTAVPVTPGSGGLSLVVYGVDPLVGTYLLMSSAVLTTTALRAFELYPGSSAAASGGVAVRQSSVLPRSFLLQILVGDAQSYTYSVHYSLIR